MASRAASFLLLVVASTISLPELALAKRQRVAPHRFAKLSHASLATMPMRMYREDCGLRRPIAMLIAQGEQAAEHARNPGAGMNQSVTPFAQVLKDGFYQVECVKDYMFEFGDKFGDNKFSYGLGSVSNVSIVLYSSLVPKEDRQPMTHETCFAFCRTIPEMLFFGITNGRECYCTPYYKPMANDDSMCDAVCEGNTATMCGGKTKSSMFAMHACSDTATDLTETSNKMEGVTTDMTATATNVTTASQGMQSAASAMQQSFGNVGDMQASELMQAAKVFAGELQHAAEGATPVGTQAAELKGKAAALAGADFQDYAKAAEAEAVLKQMEKVTADGEAKTEELESLAGKALPRKAPAGALAQYYPVMYFVDREKVGAPSTCAGASAASPMLATASECAAACDAKVGTCVGFSHFPHASADLCFLFSKLTSTTYYTGCAAGSGANGTRCMAKLAYFEGTTLAPDASGKCQKCLKKATEAKRCFQ
mmetsp:Transcript_89317/g.248038  ORF Transcript_89317/g.248038 Transcript_89317/m.248038 type:complete len:482 (-) Transcript_89317:148-1593(-)